MYYTPPTTDFGRAVMNGHLHRMNASGVAEPINGRDGPGGGMRRLVGRGLIALGTRLAAGARATVPN